MRTGTSRECLTTTATGGAIHSSQPLLVYDFENAGVERNLPNVERARERVLQAKYQLERNAHVPQLVAATASSRSAGAFALASMAAKASRAGGGVGMMNAAKLARRTPKRLESRIADLRGS
ncbi:hypothetical protein PPROV_000599900 [Pycnococcus provasolii]|uniref:Uncharacterized protein n=1 Tax=Pycnococcus provasolii TaxID=41880 RepID=A0A830HK53_9CHLO|nr:hypothetical protein PPROV_000599900 [Pycnococcus provasolii]